MAPPAENETAEGAGVGIHTKRNKRKKELAKQRKAETQAKATIEDDLFDKLSAVNLADAREPNNMSTNSKILTVPAEFLERNGSEHESEGLDQSSITVSNDVPSRLLTYSSNNTCHMDGLSEYFIEVDETLSEMKAAPGKCLGMFAIKKIKQGTEILREEAIFNGSRSWFSKHAMLTSFQMRRSPNSWPCIANAIAERKSARRLTFRKSGTLIASRLSLFLLFLYRRSMQVLSSIL
jgi:hypothetical protein